MMHNKCLIFGIVALMSLVGFHGAVAGETFAVVNTSDSEYRGSVSEVAVTVTESLASGGASTGTVTYASK